MEAEFGAKKKMRQDPEENRAFDDFKRKYSNAIVYMLSVNVSPSSLKDYLIAADNSKKFESIKKFREGALQLRPKAKQWIDKPFYLQITIVSTTVTEGGSVKTVLTVGDMVFKATTAVISTIKELETYCMLVGKIIEGEKLWQDPDMLEFTFGDRQYEEDASKKGEAVI
jgi:hypothetical protein